MTPPARPITWPRLAALHVTLAVATVAGWFELVIVGLRKAAMHEMVWTGWHTAWATPASWLLLMLPLGLLLAVACPRLPAVWGTHLAGFVPTLVAGFCVAFMFYPALHPLAILLLSLGMAVQIARAVAGRLLTATLFAQRLVRAGLVFIAGTALLVHGGRFLRERSAMARLPAAEEGAPSILLVVLDAVRAQSLSAYGYARPTSPALERLAARGTVFNQAYATAPWTLPSHGTLFTGRYHHQLDADWQTPLEDAPPTLGALLAQRGYATAGFVANTAYTSRETGVSRGFIHYEDYLVTPAELLVASALGRFVIGNPRLRGLLGYWDVPGRKWTRDVSASFLRWQERLDGRPFFAFLNLYDAHEPYLPPPEFQARFPLPAARRNKLIRQINQRMAERTGKDQMSAPERAAEQAAYDASIALIDDGIATLLQALERRGALQNTIVVVTADHGELFGEHDLFSHGNALYRPLLHVPLIVAGPDIARGLRVDSVVSLRDLAATLLALAGGPPGALPGRPLLRGPVAPPSTALAQVNPAPNQDPRYPSARGVMHAISDARFHYIRHADGSEELYATTDTAEATNLAYRPASDSVITSFRTRLAALRVQR